MRILSVGATLMDSMMKLIVALCKFVNVPKNFYESLCDPVT